MALHGPFTGQKRPHFIPAELRWFGVGSFCVEAAIAFVFISAPVYLFEYAQTIPWLAPFQLGAVTTGLIGLSLFYLLQRLACIALMPAITNTVQKIGFGFSLMLGSLFYLLQYSMLPFFSTYPWLFFVAPILSGFGLMVYWISYMTLLSAKITKTTAGQEVGSFEFVTRLAQIMAPLLGALLSARFGFLSSVMVAGFFFILGAIIFLQVPAIKTKGQWSFRSYFAWIRTSQNLRFNIAMGAFQWERFGTVIFWPVFLYLAFHRLEAVGYVLSSATFLSLMFVYVSGWVFDQNQNKSLIRLISGSLTGLLWLPRLLLLGNPLSLVFNDSIDRIVKGMYSTVFMTIVVLRARQEKIYEFMVHREITLSLTIALMLALFILALALGAPWQVALISFLVASLVSLILAAPQRKQA